MRRGWPFLLFAAVSVVHLLQILFAWPGRDVTKPMLMASLLVAVLLVAFVTDRQVIRSRRGLIGLVLLCAGIAFSLAGDVLLGPSFIAGLGCFAVAQAFYVATSLGAARDPRRRREYLVAIAYVGWMVALCILLWPFLGGMAVPLVVYGALLVATATTTNGVHWIAGLGGFFFLASDSLLAFRLFQPDFGALFPDPWQDFTIMLTYCLGEGLIALGVLRRLAKV